MTPPLLHPVLFVAVEVDLLNDDGHRLTLTGWGDTTNDAVRNAERIAEDQTGDDSYAMTDWRAAS